MKKAYLILFLLFPLLPFSSKGQSTDAPLTDDYYHLIDRYEIKQGKFAESIFTGYKAYQRKGIADFVTHQLDSLSDLNKVDEFNLQFLANDNWEWTEAAEVENKPILKIFYQKKTDLFSVDIPEFDLHVKPVLYFQMGKESDQDDLRYINTRGIELRGRINKKVSFYTFIAENQARFPSYVNSRISEQRAVPGEGFYKGFKEGGVDFFTARGYISFNATKNINIQAGQDRFFIGNGERSLILSDFGNTYPFLKIQTQIWRFSYTNLFAELRGNFPGRSSNNTDIKKFFSLHHLSLNITDNLNVGVFEAIVSGDSSGTGFELAYLNPVIFYRAIEHYTGSNKSNALVGADAKWNFLNRFQLYGQFLLDEFVLSHVRARDGWWANKWSTQIGAKYIDVFGIPNLDMQVEWNRARPFMYAHISSHTSYTHYEQPLAHPLGANFDEQLMIMRYQPLKRLFVEARYLQAKYGKDAGNTNYGGNIYKSYVTRTQEFDNELGQGTEADLKMLELNASYMLAHRLFIDASYTLRKYKEGAEGGNNSTITSLGVRWNIGRREHYF